MKKRFINILYLTVIIFIVFCIIVFCVNIFVPDGYDIKISVDFKNLSASEIDNRFSDNIKDKLLNLKRIKEILIVSRQNNVEVYCKLHSLCLLNRQTIKETVKNEILSFLQGFNEEGIVENVSIENDFNYYYNDFLVIYYDDFYKNQSFNSNTPSDSYVFLKKYTDILSDTLFDLKMIKNVKNIAPFDLADYIVFSPAQLRQFDLTLENLKDVIKENNVFENSAYYINSLNKQSYQINGSINSIDDIKNIALHFKNKDFSLKFKDVFNIFEDIKKPCEKYVFFNQSPAQVFALKPKSSLFFRLRLKLALERELKRAIKSDPCALSPISFSKNLKEKIKIKYFNIDEYALFEVNIGEADNSDKAVLSEGGFLKTFNLYKEIYKGFHKNFYENSTNEKDDIIFVLGGNFAKTKSNKAFFTDEKDSLKLTIIVKNSQKNKLKHILEDILKNTPKNNFNVQNKSNKDYTQYLKREKRVVYNMDNISLNDFNVSKKEILNTIFAYFSGLDAGSYYKNGNKISIILRNEDAFKKGSKELSEIYIYLKNYGSLTNIDTFAKSEIRNEFSAITRRFKH